MTGLAILDEGSEPAEVRSAVLSPRTRRTVHEVVAGMLTPGVTPAVCRLRRVKFKPGSKLTASYDVWVGGAHPVIRPVTVTWFADPGSAGPVTEEAVQGIEADARRRGSARPFARLAAWRPELAMRVQVWPLDPAFPQLVRLSDPDHVGRLLGHRSGRGGATEVRPIRYRPGQRHVLRYQAIGGAKTVMFAKLHAGGDHRSLGAVEAVADLLANDERGVRLGRAVAPPSPDGVVLHARVSGTPLSRSLRHPVAGERHLPRAGMALRLLHGVPASLADGLPTRDHRTEVDVTRRATGHVRRMSPAVGARTDAVLEQVARRLEGSDEPAVFSHGDFKADHLLVGRDGISLIDFDSCAAAEPALDLGKFLADLRFWYAARGHGGVPRAQGAFLAGYGDIDAHALDRARCYEALFLVRAAARRVQVTDAAWTARTSNLVGLAEAVIADPS